MIVLGGDGTVRAARRYGQARHYFEVNLGNGRFDAISRVNSQIISLG